MIYATVKSVGRTSPMHVQAIRVGSLTVIPMSINWVTDEQEAIEAALRLTEMPVLPDPDILRRLEDLRCSSP